MKKLRSDLAALAVGTIALIAASCLTGITGSAPAELWQLAVLLIGGSLGLSLPAVLTSTTSGSSTASGASTTSGAAAGTTATNAPVVTLTSTSAGAQ